MIAQTKQLKYLPIDTTEQLEVSKERRNKLLHFLSGTLLLGLQAITQRREVKLILQCGPHVVHFDLKWAKLTKSPFQSV